MRTLFLLAPSSRKDQTGFRSDCGGKKNALSLIRKLLATRYKILGTTDLGDFKAHDLALDQTVTVRQALLTSRSAGDTWRQKVQQLVLVRHPNFLNVLDVISDQSGDFVITERSRGQSIADLLKERPRLDLEDILRLLTPLAGALDLAATYSCCANAISTCWLFTEMSSSFALDLGKRSPSDWPDIVRNRSPVAFRYGDVKRRLIELWHQSLAKSEKSRSWTAFSNLNRGERKKAAYTVETNH